MLRKIYSELVLIRKELQAIRSSMESQRGYVREPYGRKIILHPEHDINRLQQKES